jgi:hypothetical protein
LRLLAEKWNSRDIHFERATPLIPTNAKPHSGKMSQQMLLHYIFSILPSDQVVLRQRWSADRNSLISVVRKRFI